MPTPTRAPRGELATYQRDAFTHAGIRHDVYRKGQGPAVLVITELPGISPEVVGFADRVVELGCTAVLPSLFDRTPDPHRDRGLGMRLLYLRTVVKVCIKREFNAFVAGRKGPVIDWLRALAASEFARCGGPGVGVVGMCFSGGFALAMAVDAHVLAPVLSQPSLPLSTSRRARRAIDCDAQSIARVRARCEAEGLRILGLRFRDDPLVPAERFAFLREQLGDGFVAVELEQGDGHPASVMRHHHCVLTQDLIDEPGQPTRAALDQVLALLRSKLGAPAASP